MPTWRALKLPRLVLLPVLHPVKRVSKHEGRATEYTDSHEDKQQQQGVEKLEELEPVGKYN
jgi:hypothetical protein